MKVILLQDIYKHGVAGQVVEVADGFARNYLIPQGMAERASKSALKAHVKLRDQVEARKAAYENKLNELGRQIDGTELIFGRLAAPTGKLFGSVTTQEIADDLLDKTGVDINRRRISQQSLREIGTFDVAVRLGTDVSPILKITIVREEELADFLKAREANDEAAMQEILAQGEAASDTETTESLIEDLDDEAVDDEADDALAEPAAELDA